MADLTANADVAWAAPSAEHSVEIENAVTLYTHALVGYQSGRLNHWADGAADRFLGLLLRPNDDTLVGNTSATPIPPQGVVRSDGITLRNLASVGNITDETDQGTAVYCGTSNTDDLTTDSTGRTHVIGYVRRVGSTTDVDVTLYSAGEAHAHAQA